jgi:hypothetical protein
MAILDDMHPVFWALRCTRRETLRERFTWAHFLTNASESRRNCYSLAVRYFHQYWHMATVHPVISRTQRKGNDDTGRDS